jgi:preprotein translocase subunit SecG
LQRGKGAEAGAGFGSGASGTVFGARGTSTLFSKMTAVFAALFFCTSLLLAYMGAHGIGTQAPNSILERQALQQPVTPAPAVQAPPTQAPAAAPAETSPPPPADPVKK